MVTAPIAIVPNVRKTKDSEPVINTDRRTYHVELRATAASYMASVSWTYPADELIALQVAEAEAAKNQWRNAGRSEEHTSELQSLMRISYAVFCLKKKKHQDKITIEKH